MGHFRQSFLSLRLNPSEFYDFPYVSGIVEVTLPQPRKHLSIINDLAESVWETLVGVSRCTVDRVCWPSYPQITLYWAAGRRRGCRGMKSSSVGPCVPLIEAHTLLSRLPPALWAALPACYTAFHRGLSHPCMHSLLQLLSIPLLLLLCCFLTDCPHRSSFPGPDCSTTSKQTYFSASQPWFLTNILGFLESNILTACNLVHWLLFLSASTRPKTLGLI